MPVSDSDCPIDKHYIKKLQSKKDRFLVPDSDLSKELINVTKWLFDQCIFNLKDL